MFQFLGYLARMKLIRRWSLMKSVTDENIAEHSAQVAQIAHALALIGILIFGRSYNAERCALLALYHDTTEVITGDIGNVAQPILRDPQIIARKLRVWQTGSYSRCCRPNYARITVY